MIYVAHFLYCHISSLFIHFPYCSLSITIESLTVLVIRESLENKSAMEISCFREDGQQKCEQKMKMDISDHDTN